MISRFLLLFLLVGLTSHFAFAQVLDRVQRGGGQVIITDNGSVRVAPKIGASIIQISSCASAPISTSNVAHWCYDATTGAMRISANGGPYVNWSNPGAGPGTVSSVGLALPSSIFLVSGSPVTTSGTLTATLQGQTANYVFAAPDGAPGAPLFRALVAADIPALDAAKITTGILTAVRGGTGIGSYSQGAMLYANTSTTLAQVAPYFGTARRFLMATGDGSTPDPPAFAQPAFSDLSGTAAISQGGTGQTALGTANYLLGVNAAGNASQYWNLVAGSNVAINRAGANITISATGTLSGDFRATDGAFATPSFSFTNETGLGLYRATSGVLGVAAPTMQQTAAARPTHSFVTSGSTGQGRVFSAVANWFGLTSNLIYTGTQWNLDDTSRGGVIANADTQTAGAPVFNFAFATAGTNPRTPTTPVQIKPDGVTLNTGAGVTYADASRGVSVVPSEHTVAEFFNLDVPRVVNVTTWTSLTRGPVTQDTNGGTTTTFMDYSAFIDAGAWSGVNFVFEARWLATGTGTLNVCRIRLVNLTDSTVLGESLAKVWNDYNGKPGRGATFTITGTGTKRLGVQVMNDASQACSYFSARLIARPLVSYCGRDGLAQCY